MPDLKKNKPYQARITATNTQGESLPSAPSEAFTVEPAKSSEAKPKLDDGEKPTIKRQPSETASVKSEKEPSIGPEEELGSEGPGGN